MPAPSVKPAALVLRLILVFGLAGISGVEARPEESPPDLCRTFSCEEGGIIRGRLDRKDMALIFTGGDFSEGGPHIRSVLKARGIKAGFFFTGDFYRNPRNNDLIRGLAADGHYLGAHSDKHLLYCSWDDRSRTLVTREEFRRDIQANFHEMEKFGIASENARLFIPPYEWYNREITSWAGELGLVLFNFTPGTTSNADYTTPLLPEYLSAQKIYDNILRYERSDPRGLNGFILLIHIGAAPERADKFYLRLGPLLDELQTRGYGFVRIDELLASN